MLALIENVGGVDVSGVLAEYQDCQGSKYHTPNPLILRCYVVRWEQGSGRRTKLQPCEDSDQDFVWLCGTCASNLDIFLSLMDATDGNVPWETRREFGNLIRSLGLDRWKRTETHG